MALGKISFALLFLAVSPACAQAQSYNPNQTQSPSPPASTAPVPDSKPVLTHRAPAAPAPSPPSHETVSITVPKGTSLQVVIDKELRIRKVGQFVHGRTVDPVYAFDKLVIPVGTEVTGKITQLDSISNPKRIVEALNADFSPARKVTIEFNEIALSTGKHIPIQTVVTPGSGQVIEFVTSAEKGHNRSLKDSASDKAREAKERAKQEWDNAIAQVEEPGRLHRVRRYLVAQFPVHPQYIDPGTVYFGELESPLEFGAEPLTPEMAKSIGAVPPTGSSVRARLSMSVSSATAKKGDEIEATLSQPLFDGNLLIFPQGSLLKGSVAQVQPARHMTRNGQLRVTFLEIVPPDGIEQKIQASLEGVQSGKAQDLKLDSEGGAEAQTPKTRYLQTAIAVGLAAASSGDDILNQAEGGAGGFRVVGIVIGATIRSQPLGMAMGALGASRSIYIHFLARGRDVVFPKNTAMQIGISPRPSPPPPQPGANIAKR
jgi:hypothetical protein